MNKAGKKIALVSNSTWSLYNFRLDLIRFIKNLGFEVLIMAPRDEFADLLEAEGCRFFNLSFNNRSENPLKDLGLYRQLYGIYRRERPDLIFHYVIKPNIYGSLAAGRLGLRSIAIVTGLGYSFARKNWLSRLVRMLYHRALRQVSEVWFLNNEDAGIFVREKITNIEKVKVLPGEGVNTEHFAPGAAKVSTTKFRFLMSTRLLRSKGIQLYADAARILRNKGLEADFDLIGFFEKNHPDSIGEEDLKKWEQEGLIRYHGFARDVRGYLREADCFVFPSFYNEGVPRCLMEAASMQLPIITSLNRGCKEVVVDGLNGFLCHQHDPFDLAAKMEQMLRLSSEQRHKLGENGRRLVTDKFDISLVLKEYGRVLEKFSGSV